jgi:hypothetical protein
MAGAAGRMRRAGIWARNLHPGWVYSNRICVNPLHFVVRMFVNTFGITQPTPEAEATAGRVIVAMLAGVLVLLVAVGWLLRVAFTH